jgi:hypothetical protein
MTNYNYNGLNAYDIANKIIEKEESYLSIDFDTLSFEDKCRYAAHHNGIYHPLFRNGRSIEELNTEIMPEIIRRSEAGDSNAMFYLCMFHPDVAHRSEEHKAMVEQAMEKGSCEARIYYASWFCKNNDSKAYELLAEVLNMYSLGEVTVSDEKNLYDCCAVMLRRLMEVLLVLSFQKNGVEDLIMDKGNLYHVSLDKMINIASSCSELSLSASTKKDMHTIKDLGNYSAHRIWYNCTKKDIEPNIMKYRAIIEELMYKSEIKE